LYTLTIFFKNLAHILILTLSIIFHTLLIFYPNPPIILSIKIYHFNIYLIPTKVFYWIHIRIVILNRIVMFHIFSLKHLINLIFTYHIDFLILYIINYDSQFNYIIPSIIILYIYFHIILFICYNLFLI
jgi:hypothetical protein